MQKKYRSLLYKLALMFLFFVANYSYSSAQEQQIYFGKLTSKHGLSENVVNAIYQDSRGFMWFGTNDGLNKFDGYYFTVLEPDATKAGAINSNLIFAITEDHHQRLWVGTTGKGINYFSLDEEYFSAIRHDPNNEQSLSSDYISNLLTDRMGRIWVCTNKGLDVITFDKSLNPQVHRVASRNTNNIPNPTKLHEDKKGNIWIATRNGLFKIDLPQSVEEIVIKNIAFDQDEKGLSIQDLGEDHQGRLIVSTTKGIFLQRIANKDDAFELVSNITFGYAIAEDKNKQIWIGTYSGLQHFSNEKPGELPIFKNQYSTSLENPEGIGNNIIRCLFIDKKGLIWLGTNGGGINYFDPNRKPFLHFGKKLITDGQNYTKLRSMLMDSNDYLWIGTEGGGLFHNQGKDYESFKNFESSNRPFTIEEIKLGQKKFLWVGSEDTPFLRQIDISTGQPTTTKIIEGFNLSVFAVLQDKSGIIWIGTYNGGLHRWIPKADGTFEKTTFYHEKEQPNSLSNNIIRKIYEDNLGNIWVGTGGGLNRISATKKLTDQLNFEIFKHIPEDANSLSHDYILDIYESANGMIWVATLGGGLNRLNPTTNAFNTYNEQSGLPNMTIKSILDDHQGNIWFTSNKGLSQLNPVSGSIKNYYSSSGLQGYEFLEGVAVKKQEGTLLFGGSNGFNAFNPEAIKDTKTPPKVLFTNLEVLNKKVHIGDTLNNRILLKKGLTETEEIELLYQENNFSVEFSALDYAGASSTKYEYKLDGFDQEWIKSEVDSRKAIYTNLTAGDYTLKVKAANQDGYWSATPAMLKIKVVPPWYLTMPAYLVYLLGVIGLLYLFRHYELINIKEKHDLKLERVNKEKREELNRMKLQFFTNISHELRTPLTLIIAPLEHLMQKSKTFTAEEMQYQFHFMYKNSKYLLRMVNQLLDFRKLDQGKMELTARQGDIVVFVKEIIEPFQFLANKQKINFSFNSNVEGTFMWYDQQFVEKIVYNLLSNAFKFTPENGQIIVGLKEIAKPSRLKSKSKHFLEISVEDSGPGMSKTVSKKVFQRFFKEGGKGENKDGAGIGLAYTKSLVERHYGQIKLETEKGKGTIFKVMLPMDRAAFDKQEINRKPIEVFDKSADPLEYFMPEPINEVSNISPTDIPAELPVDDLPLLLFIDDNADIRRFIQDGLKNDFRVIIAENGKVGYDMATTSLPDLIISDIMMPEMDGIELCKLIKSETNTSHIPVVLLTAKTATESELEGLQTGADAYVRKPFKLNILKMQLLNIHRRREQLKERFRKDIILQPAEITVTSADEQFLKNAVDLVQENMDNSEFNVEQLVKSMFISRSKLYLKIKALTGQSTSEFIRTIRLKRAIQLLEGSDYTIKEIMFMTGFNTASYFSKCFKQQFGMVPSEYVRKKAKPINSKYLKTPF